MLELINIRFHPTKDVDTDLSRKIQRLIQLHQQYIKAGSFNNWGEDEKETIKNNFTYHSSKIEGLTLSYGETIRFLKDSIVHPGMKMKDVYDLKNHKDVLDKIFSTFEQTSLTEKTIKNLHGELMKDDAQWEVQDPYLAPAGQYKTENNYTLRPGGLSHEYMDYQQVPGAIQKLVKEIQEQLMPSIIPDNHYSIHSLTTIANFHYEFLQIHPFSDGNGRMARLLTTLLLLKNKFPPIMIEEQERPGYFKAIIDSEQDPSRLAIVTFFIDKSIEALMDKLSPDK